MTKEEFVQRVIDANPKDFKKNNQGEPSKKSAERIVDSVFAVVKEAVTDGDTIIYPGFGTFKSAHRDATTARNIQTGEMIEVPAKTVVKFKPSPKFKTMVDDASK